MREVGRRWPGCSGAIALGALILCLLGASAADAADRVYWSEAAGRIAFANLDGSGLAELSTAGAKFAGPAGTAIDPLTERIYWLNQDGGNAFKGAGISFANLDGSGGGVLPTPGATFVESEGLAIDPVGRRIYWANLNSNTIAVANLDGAGGNTLNTAGATVSAPRGVAIDPIAGRIYWANQVFGKPISFARLDGTGGGGDFSNDQSETSSFPVLRVTPRSTAPPAISGGSTPGSVLSCSQGTWAPDFVESFLYQAAKSFTLQWSRNGADIPGATKSTLTADAVSGDYRCLVTAENGAGATVAITAPHHVGIQTTGGGGPDHSVNLTLKLAATKTGADAPLAVVVANDGAIAVTGSVSGRSTVGQGPGKHLVKLASRPFQVGAHASTIVKLQLPKPLRSLLTHRNRLSIALSATFAPAGGERQTVMQAVAPKLLGKKGH